MIPRARISKAAANLIHKGFCWVYRDHILYLDEVQPGQLVLIEDLAGHLLGSAQYSSESKIALRVWTRGPEAPDEEALLRSRLERAWALRDRLLPDRAARRMVYGEADGLPGTVIDQYRTASGDALVVQTLTQGAEARQEALLRLLIEMHAPAWMVLRNDVRVRQLEGLPLYKRAVVGEAPFQVEVRQGGVRRVADLWEGQKTGMFLDQRENHLYAQSVARGRVLDLFTYAGGFALHCAGGADRVVAVDSSAPALEWGRRSARLSGFENIDWVCSNAFDWLKEASAAGERFDLVIVDPPAFAKRRADLAAGTRAYRDLNRRAISVLADRGLLITCSCSANLGEDEFLDIVRQAAESAGRSLSLLERRGQGPDHPEALGVPESRYLKCLVLASSPR